MLATSRVAPVDMILWSFHYTGLRKIKLISYKLGLSFEFDNSLYKKVEAPFLPVWLISENVLWLFWRYFKVWFKTIKLRIFLTHYSFGSVHLWIRIWGLTIISIAQIVSQCLLDRWMRFWNRESSWVILALSTKSRTNTSTSTIGYLRGLV